MNSKIPRIPTIYMCKIQGSKLFRTRVGSIS